MCIPYELYLFDGEMSVGIFNKINIAPGWVILYHRTVDTSASIHMLGEYIPSAIYTVVSMYDGKETH